MFLRYVLEKVKNCKPIAISNNEKVDLDEMHGYFGNVIADIEKDMKRKPGNTEFNYVMRVSK